MPFCAMSLKARLPFLAGAQHSVELRPRRVSGGPVVGHCEQLPHASLASGDPWPKCLKGKLYAKFGAIGDLPW